MEVLHTNISYFVFPQIIIYTVLFCDGWQSRGNCLRVAVSVVQMKNWTTDENRMSASFASVLLEYSTPYKWIAMGLVHTSLVYERIANRRGTLRFLSHYSRYE